VPADRGDVRTAAGRDVGDHPPITPTRAIREADTFRNPAERQVYSQAPAHKKSLWGAGGGGFEWTGERVECPREVRATNPPSTRRGLPGTMWFDTLWRRPSGVAHQGRQEEHSPHTLCARDRFNRGFGCSRPIAEFPQ